MATTATRRWWRRRNGGDDDPDDLVPMDTQGRLLVPQFGNFVLTSPTVFAQRVFAGFLLGYAAFLVYSSFHHAWSPWELRYHAYFMEDLPAPMVIIAGLIPLLKTSFDLNIQNCVIADWTAALACVFAVKGLLQNSGPSKKWMWYSCYIGILVATFWTYYILRLPQIRWDVAWLPLGPLIAGALSLYVDHVLLESMKDISTLRSYMYNFKAL
ncbi:hypothetical protein HU200_050317 [Digitaria exilis]|uniref:Uncharacterized protein n=1 Tax=Digitaria exilis TaxID=1010633 RepID=A0A835AS09_9POAL|nr:hypothetical protein HU200_050317 [Digitaria exilis]